jgi:hypothetical protein
LEHSKVHVERVWPEISCKIQMVKSGKSVSGDTAHLRREEKKNESERPIVTRKYAWGGMRFITSSTYPCHHSLQH